MQALTQALAAGRDASARLSAVMSTLSGFVRLDRAELDRVALDELLSDVVDMCRPHFRADTEVQLELAGGLTPRVDGRRLGDAFATVVRNAGESLDGPGSVAIRLSSDDGWARVEVEDSGRGMSPEQIRSAFDIDFAHDERVRARFGLPLCRSVMHRLGGDVTLESEPGRGTRVVMRLPLGAES
jgi:signal transduction histidine kinase